MFSTPLFRLVFSLVLLGAAGFLLFGVIAKSRPAPVLRNTPAYEQLADHMARETAAILEPGSKIVVVLDGNKTFVGGYAGTCRTVFEKRLGETRDGPQVIGWEEYPMGPCGTVMNPEFFNSLVKKYPEADAVVSFVGPPSYPAHSHPTDLESLPLIIAHTDYFDELPDLIADGIVTAAVLFEPATGPDGPALSVKTITLANVSDLASWKKSNSVALAGAFKF